MSDTYIRRLRSVQRELDVVRASLTYAAQGWQKHGTIAESDAFQYKDFVAADRNIETTYFIRVYAEFEGVLKDHLMRNHPLVDIPPKPKVDELISRVMRAESLQIDPALRKKMNDIRDYRNSLAHRSPVRLAPIPFAEALSTLNRFLDKLPEPYKP